ncbi:uncharacterized protein LOC126737354 [Anthonomus grandis grandis]|uniref:uncharacterized protein LOC126737354 n=1 Tax=Anthonomus grandis grandis TaxID=2921223 RepID=UPI00216518B9|nr:uncharacterized protein LOC126737354 [Anthonomus grandis grandis]
MSSDEDVALLSVLILRRRKKKHNQKYWVRPYSTANLHRSIFKSCTGEEMMEDQAKFQSVYRMSRETFLVLLDIIGPSIKSSVKKFRESITPKEKLIITMRYLATAMSFKQLSFLFMRGDSTIGQLVEEVCDNIWSGLQMEFMPFPSELQWIEKAERFDELWNLPNCIGSIDGKPIRIHCPAKTGFAFYNYKSYFSLQLLAIADADSNFTAIDVGDYGRNGDGVFKNSSIGRNFQANTLNFPPPQPLPKEPHEPAFPYYFVGDAAFPLCKKLLKPYPLRNLTNPKRIINYRLSRARRSVECAFGIMVSKFKILE